MRKNRDLNHLFNLKIFHTIISFTNEISLLVSLHFWCPITHRFSSGCLNWTWTFGSDVRSLFLADKSPKLLACWIFWNISGLVCEFLHTYLVMLQKIKLHSVRKHINPQSTIRCRGYSDGNWGLVSYANCNAVSR